MQTRSFLSLAALCLIITSHACAQFFSETPRLQTRVDTLAGWRRAYYEGYTQSPSVAQGDTIKFMVSCLGAYIPQQQPDVIASRMKIYRIGANRTTDSLITPSPISFNCTFYPLHNKNGLSIMPDYDPRPIGANTVYPVEYKKGCNWPAALSFIVPSGWRSGIYYARIYQQGFENDETKVGYIPFVVKSANPDSTSKILFVVAWNTYQAYNYWGGGGFYWWTGVFDPNDGPGGMPKAYQDTVSFLRPLGYHWSEGEGVGFLMCNPLGQIRDREDTFIHWAEGEGQVMEYCADVDVHSDDPFDPFAPLPFLRNYRTAIFPGHSEYWSLPERGNLENAQVSQPGFKGNLGYNLAFLCSNTCYWKVDFLDGDTKRMYRDKYNGPAWLPQSLWRRDDTYHGEGRLLSVQFEQVTAPYGVDPAYACCTRYPFPPNVVFNNAHWIYKGMTVQRGDQIGRGDPAQGIEPITGQEVDYIHQADSPVHLYTSRIDTLARVFIRKLCVDPPCGELNSTDSIFSDIAYYEDTVSNARVFAGGGAGWSRNLYGMDSVIMRTMTRNVLDHFSWKKYAGGVHRPLLEFSDDIEFDADVIVHPAKTLRVTDAPVTIDSAVVFFIDGTLEISGNVAIAGNGSLNINPGGVLLLKTNSTLTISPSAYFVLENGGDVVFESGAKLILNHATVEAGATLSVESGGTLQIQPAGQIAFGDGSRLVTYGPLAAIGTSQYPITFARHPSASNWLGIYVQSGLAVSELRHCEITDAITGVSVNSSRFKLKESTVSDCSVGIDLSGYHPKFFYQIDTNTVQNCRTTGIVIGNASNVTLHDNTILGCSTGLITTQVTSRLYRNVIQNSSEEGVFAGEYSNPRFGDVLLADPGNNVIRNSSLCELHAVNSTPFLGVGCERVYGGWNSVYGDAILVNAEKGAYVSANWNWWGIDPPKAEQFISDGESWIDYDCWMTYDPNEGMRPSGSPSLTAGGKGGNDPPPILSITPERAKLLQALSLRGQGDYRRALGVYANLIRTSPNASEARVALSELRNTFHDFILSSNDSTLQGALEDSLRTHRINHPNALLRRLAKALAATEITNQRDFAAAIAEYNQLLQSSTTDIERAICLFALFNINSQGIQDRSEAQRYLTQLQALYPTDIRTRIASARFASMIDAQGGNGCRSLRSQEVQSR